MIQPGVIAFSRILSPPRSRARPRVMIVNSPIHRVHRKSQVLDLLRAGVIAHATYDSEIEAIEQCGELAVVMGSEKLTNTPDGPLLSRRFTNVWRPEGDSWRLVVRQATLIG